MSFCDLPRMEIRFFTPNMDHPLPPDDDELSFNQGYLNAATGELKLKTHSGVITLGTISPGSVTEAMLQNGVVTPPKLSSKLLKVAAVNPTINDDSGDGHAPGSVWINTATLMAYTCVDATAGAAVWRKITSAEDLASLIAGSTGFDQLNVGSSDGTALVVSANTITVSKTRHTVNTSSGNRLVQTINGGVEGDILFLSPSSNSGRLQFNSPTNINLFTSSPSGISLQSTKEVIAFIFKGTQWYQLSIPTFDVKNGPLASAASYAARGLSLPRNSLTDLGGTQPRLNVIPNAAARNFFIVRAAAATTVSIGVAAMTNILTPAEASDADGTFINHATAAAAGSGAGWVSPTFNLIMPNHWPEWIIYVKTGALTTDIQNMRWWMGLTSAALTNVSDPGAGTRFIGFRFDTVAGDTAFRPAVDDGTTLQLGTGFEAPAAGTPYLLRIWADNAGTFFFSVNDGFVETLSASGILGTKMGVTDVAFTTNATAKNHKFGMMYVEGR